MSLNATIARLQLSSFPEVIAERVLKRDDVITLAAMGSAEVGAIGTIHFSDIRTALSNCEFGKSIEIHRRTGMGLISIARVVTGLHAIRDASGPEVVLPEFGLLDPAESVRLNAFSEVVKRARHSWPNHNYWRGVLVGQPLTDSEFGRLIRELQHLVEPELSRISAAVTRGSFGVSDLVPSDAAYYQSLVGGIASVESSDEYVVKMLTPHLTSVFNADPSWGLRLIRAASVCTTLDWVAITGSATDDDLFAKLKALGPGATPLSRLSIFRIAQARSASDVRFSELRDDALNKLLERSAPNANGHEPDELFPALMRLTLNAISMNEELALAPPYWRRLAAFAHATILLESISFQGWDREALTTWCAAQQSLDNAAVGILDLIRDPFWRADFQTTSNLSIAALMTALKWRPNSIDHLNGLSSKQAALTQGLNSKFLLAFGLPNPLLGRRSRQIDGLEQTYGLELLEGYTSDDPTAVALNSYQAWSAFAYSSRIFSFSNELLERLREIARSIHLHASTISDEEAAILSCVAEVAVLQRDEELAGILAICVLRGAENITESIDAAKSAAVLVIASGASPNWNGSLAWAAERLVTLAYQIPRGSSCEELANWIEVMQKFIPLEERRWGKAWIIARSASQ